MTSWRVEWEEAGTARTHEVPNVPSAVDAVWRTALEEVDDATNAKLIDVIRLA